LNNCAKYKFENMNCQIWGF